jgi:hypothetical protein
MVYQILRCLKIDLINHQIFYLQIFNIFIFVFLFLKIYVNLHLLNYNLITFILIIYHLLLIILLFETILIEIIPFGYEIHRSLLYDFLIVFDIYQCII